MYNRQFIRLLIIFLSENLVLSNICVTHTKCLSYGVDFRARKLLIFPLIIVGGFSLSVLFFYRKSDVFSILFPFAKNKFKPHTT